MDKKTQFGIDYLSFMWELVTLTNNSDPVAWACVKMCLLNWGFSAEELHNVIGLHDKQVNQMKSMSEAKIRQYGNDASSRFINYVSDNDVTKKRLLYQMAVIASLNLSLSQEANNLINTFGSMLKISGKDLQEIIRKGQDYSLFLNIFGITYAFAEREKTIFPKLSGQVV